jgi:hypothetical protein
MKTIVNQIERRVERLEQRVEAARVPEPVPVLLGELCETRVAIREWHGVGLHDRVVCVLVEDKSARD